MAKHRPIDRYFWALFGGVWLFVGVLFLIIGGATGYKAYQVQQARSDPSLPSASGTVLVKYFDSETAPPDFGVEYRFFTADGRKAYGSARVQPATWDSLREQQSVRVFYDPRNPDRNWIEGERQNHLLPLIFSGLGFLLTIPGGIIVHKAFRKRTA